MDNYSKQGLGLGDQPATPERFALPMIIICPARFGKDGVAATGTKTPDSAAGASPPFWIQEGSQFNWRSHSLERQRP